MLLVVCCVCDWAAAQNVPAPTPPTITILRATPAIFLPPTSDPMPEIILKRGGKIQISMTISVAGNPPPSGYMQLVRAIDSNTTLVSEVKTPTDGKYTITYTVTKADIGATLGFAATATGPRINGKPPEISQMERGIRIKAEPEPPLPPPRTNGVHRVHLRQPKTWWPLYQPWQPWW